MAELWKCPVCGAEYESPVPVASVQVRHNKYKCRGIMKKVEE